MRFATARTTCLKPWRAKWKSKKSYPSGLAGELPASFHRDPKREFATREPGGPSVGMSALCLS